MDAFAGTTTELQRALRIMGFPAPGRAGRELLQHLLLMAAAQRVFREMPHALSEPERDQLPPKRGTCHGWDGNRFWRPAFIREEEMGPRTRPLYASKEDAKTCARRALIRALLSDLVEMELADQEDGG